MQFLGVGIAHGADAVFVSAFMAARSFYYSIRPNANSSGGDEDDKYKENFDECCPHPFRGPFGSPLFAASIRNNAQAWVCCGLFYQL
jgi:hypothetical protein